jgi:pimeloyl-ACP methyl ester carboxylesterase
MSSVSTFLKDVETVASWNAKKCFNNPNTKLPKEYITITVKNVDKEEMAAPFVFQQASAEEDAVIYVSLTNTSPRTLWVSFLMFGCDFSITNEYLAKRELKPGQTAVMEVGNNPYITSWIPKQLYSWGVNEVQEIFRVFVSTDEPETDVHNQKGLEMDERSAFQGLRVARNTAIVTANEDWCIFDIPYSLTAPMPEQYLDQNRAVSLTDWMSVQSPKGFSAKATLSADSPAQRTLSNRPARSVIGASKVALAEGLSNTPPLEVLELKGIEGKLSEANPLKIKVKNVGKEDHVIALQYDEKSGLYFPVGRSVDGVIHITNTPKNEVEVVNTRSLLGTAKILFQKLIVSKLTGEYEYPLLRMAQFSSNQDENFTYINDAKAIESAIESAENIVLFVHGIIGDTTEMTKSAIRAKKKEKPIYDNYQLVLTFDYESVSTSIEQTAADLKARLEAIGLVAGHGRKLDIIAHSMGGLVSRHFIEKLEGNQVVTRLIQLGTPNMGSEAAQLTDIVKTYSMLAINGLPALAPWMTPLTLFANYLVKNAQVTLNQLKPTSDFLKKLNDGTDPGIPYHIIAGNTKLIKKTYPKETTFIQKVIANLKEQGVYYVLEQSIFKSDNDLVVRTESAKGIAGKEGRAQPITEVEIANDHLSFFYKPEGLKALVDVIYGKKP